MASKNNNDTSTSRSADTVICENLKVIKRDKKTAESNYASNHTLQKSKEAARRYKICTLDKAEESHGVYQDIMTCVTISNHKKTEIIKGRIDEYIKEDDEIEKRIKDASKLLNDMRIKIEDAHNAACAMSNCVKNKILPKSGKSTKDDKIVEIGEQLNEIMHKTKELDEKGQNAFESAVTIAGIQTFTNTMSLKEFAAQLSVAMTDFKGTVDSNIQSTSTDVIGCREELNVVVEELAQIVCDKKAESTKKQGLGDVIEFVCEGEYEDECLDLCKDIKNCYETDGDYDQRSKNRRKRRQTADQN